MIAPPDGSVFVENSQALSPDGTKWAFVAKNKDGKDLLWVRPLNSLTAQQLNAIRDTYGTLPKNVTSGWVASRLSGDTGVPPFCSSK